MRSGFAIRPGGVGLLKTPNHRHQVLRRRLIALAAVLGLALASGLIGALIHPTAPPVNHPATSPFSYFPSA